MPQNKKIERYQKLFQRNLMFIFVLRRLSVHLFSISTVLSFAGALWSVGGAAGKGIVLLLIICPPVIPPDAQWQADTRAYSPRVTDVFIHTSSEGGIWQFLHMSLYVIILSLVSLVDSLAVLTYFIHSSFSATSRKKGYTRGQPFPFFARKGVLHNIDFVFIFAYSLRVGQQE